MKGNQISACLASFTFNNSSGAGLCVRTALFRSSIECFSTAILSKSCTSGFHEDTEKNLFREPRLHLTSNNSVKNTIITAVSCLVESLTVFWQKYLCGFLTSRKHDIYELDAFFIATLSKSEMQISTGLSTTLCLEPWLGDRSIHIFANRCIAIGRIIFLDHWVRSAA